MQHRTAVAMRREMIVLWRNARCSNELATSSFSVALTSAQLPSAMSHRSLPTAAGYGVSQAVGCAVPPQDGSRLCGEAHLVCTHP